MSKRPRRNRKADPHGLETLPESVVGSPAYQAFEAQLQRSLEALVGRWSHVAPPMSLNVRRMLPLSNEREPA